MRYARGQNVGRPNISKTFGISKPKGIHMLAKAVYGYLSMVDGDWLNFLMIIALLKNVHFKYKYI